MATTIRGGQIRDDTISRDKMDASVFYSTLTSIDNTDSPYAPLAADDVILVDSTTASVLIDLPALGTVADGRMIIIKDSGGAAAANNITVDPSGFELIDGGGARVLTSNYEVLVLIKTTPQWIQV